MVAAMPHNVAKTTSKRNLTTNDLRSVAIGIAAAVAIVMLASAMTSDSGSVSASESELNDLSAKRFVSISITTVAGDNTVTNAEASAGFTVAGVTDETGETVTAELLMPSQQMLQLGHFLACLMMMEPEHMPI